MVNSVSLPGVAHVLRHHRGSWTLEVWTGQEWASNPLPPYRLREAEREAGYTEKSAPLPFLTGPGDGKVSFSSDDFPGGGEFAYELNELLLAARETYGRGVVVFDGVPVEGGGWEFFLGRVPFTEADAAALGFRKGTSTHPLIDVSWEEAVELCARAGLLLPSENAWEYAATAGDGRIYPWGNDAPDNHLLVWSGSAISRTGPELVGSRPRGASPFGALDLAGNVWEWTSSPWRSECDPNAAEDAPFRVQTKRDDDTPRKGDNTLATNLGGSWSTTRGLGVEAVGAFGRPKADVRTDLGFRGVRVFRGSDWSNDVTTVARSADRGWSVPNDRFCNIGLRAAHVYRGSSWIVGVASGARSAFRNGFVPSGRDVALGLRCARGVL